MQIEVLKGEKVKTHEADLLIPLASEGSIMVQLRNEGRKASQIAKEFEDADAIRTDDGREYEGYSDVIVVFRMNAGTVQVRMKQEE